MKIIHAMRKIGTIITEYVPCYPVEGERWISLDLSGKPNPYYSQTQQGLFFEVFYKTPGSLWTPWGRWDCWYNQKGEWEEIIETLMDRLGLELNTSSRYDERYGQIGPVYGITKVDSLPLPEPIAKSSDNFTGFHEALAKWRELIREMKE